MIKSLVKIFIVLLSAYSCGKEDDERVIHDQADETPAPKKEKESPAPAPKDKPKGPAKKTITNPKKEVSNDALSQPDALPMDAARPLWVLKYTDAANNKYTATILSISKGLLNVDVRKNGAIFNKIEDRRIFMYPSFSAKAKKYMTYAERETDDFFYKQQTYTYSRNIETLMFRRNRTNGECQFKIIIDGWRSDTELTLSGHCDKL